MSNNPYPPTMGGKYTVKMPYLRHVTQPTDDSCVMTSLAIAADLELEDTMKYHDRYLNCDITLEQIMDDLSVDYRTVLHRGIHAGEVYILEVPSLGARGETHAIVAYANPITLDIEIYDPSYGRGDVYYHTDQKILNNDDFAFKLKCFYIMTRIVQRRTIVAC